MKFFCKIQLFLDFLLDTTPVLKPDKNIILIASWEKVLERLSERKSFDKIESKSLEFKKRIYEFYKTKCKGEIVNTDCSIDETYKNVLKFTFWKVFIEFIILYIYM